MTAAPETDPDELIGRCYTRARRSPVMVGLVKTGFGKPIRLPFGPYTITQLAAIVVSAVVLVTTRPVWGGHGFLDALVLIVIPFGAAFTLRYVHIDGRNPAAALASVAVMLCGPRWGRTQGRTYRPARPRYCTTTTTLAASPLPAGAGAQQEPPAPSTHAAPARPHHADPETGPAPAPARVVSGAQALLARTTSRES